MSTKKRAKLSKKPVEIKKTGDIVRVIYDSVSFPTQFSRLEGGIERHFPQLDIVGEDYPLPPTKLQWTRIIFALQAVLTVFIMAGDWLMNAIGFPMSEAFLETFIKYRFVALPMVMVFSPVRQILSNTGAFEVYINDKLVHSSLDSGRSISFENLKAILVQYGFKPVAPAAK
ncbi:hypothetical protein THRCLA_06729 [Thraustotheca clavata]|uniref:Selenoprotein T n=1 Tax=Thraustotheca clavata TaxID=74557 RepID=A0A1V9ZK77_9STRA|nr:hypothetical protein THRCLA_06729 [Thraustotheca clavata]